ASARPKRVGAREETGTCGSTSLCVLWPAVADPRFLSTFFQLRTQLLFQMPARSLLDRASLRSDSLLFRLPFLACARFGRAGQMRNLWPLCTHFAFVRPGIRIHGETLTISNADGKHSQTLGAGSGEHRPLACC